MSNILNYYILHSTYFLALKCKEYFVVATRIINIKIIVVKSFFIEKKYLTDY